MKVKIVAGQADINALIDEVGPARWLIAQKTALVHIDQDSRLAGAYAEIDGALYYTADTAAGRRMLARIAAGELEEKP